MSTFLNFLNLDKGTPIAFEPNPLVQADADTLAVISGSALSLIFAYAPGAADAYSRLSGTHKRLVMLGLLALTALAIYGLGCTSWAAALGLDVACDSAGAVGMLRAFVLALAANQTTFLVSPPSARLRRSNGEAA